MALAVMFRFDELTTGLTVVSFAEFFACFVAIVFKLFRRCYILCTKRILIDLMLIP